MARICGKSRQIKAIRKQNHHKSIRKAGKSSRNSHQKASETIKIQYPGVQNHQNPRNRVLKAIRSSHIQESAHLRGHIQGSSRKTRKSDHISSQTAHIQESASKIISKPSKSKQNHENPLKIDSKSRKPKEIQGNRESQPAHIQESAYLRGPISISRPRKALKTIKSLKIDSFGLIF